VELSAGDCKNDPLHELGKIQPHGSLIAFHATTLRAHYCSANVMEILGLTPAEIFGKTGEQCLGAHWPSIADLASRRDIYNLNSPDLPSPLDVASHKKGDYLIYEFEPNDSPTPHWWDFGERMLFLKELSGASTIDACRTLVVDWLFNRTGYDRVMYYHFLPDLHGEVVAERCRPGIDSYLGLHFPAGDIPPNAHALYTKNFQRIIADVRAPDVPLLAQSAEAPPLNLGASMLRSVHPVHIQYLGNMGVSASFSISIVVKKKLHALVACHHMMPNILHLNDRLAFEEIAHLTSLHLESVLELHSRDTRADLRQQISHIEGALSAAPTDVTVGMARHLHLIQHLLGSPSVWLHYNNTDSVSGIVPSHQELSALGQWLDTFEKDEVTTCHCLPHRLAQYPTLAKHACGILHIPLTPGNYLVLLRPEIVQDIPWAGKPQDLEHALTDTESSLSPRTSFDKWVQQTRSTAIPWNEIELDFARELREDIMSYINRTQLERSALYDALTGLANRQQLEQKMDEALNDCRNRGRIFAVHMLDLDKFKPVNDTFGHAAGDKLLQEVAERLLGLVRQTDTVARLGGDEFVIIQTGVVSDVGADTLAEKIVQKIAEPFLIENEDVTIGISVGTAICSQNCTDSSHLLYQADTALYTAKRNGRSQHQRHIAEM
jgi:diguanylate cyclase (GGDEF)-like protein